MTRRQLMHLQRAGGIFFIIATIIILKVASTGTDVISQDAFLKGLSLSSPISIALQVPLYPQGVMYYVKTILFL